MKKYRENMTEKEEFNRKRAEDMRNKVKDKPSVIEEEQKADPWMQRKEEASTSV